MMMTEETYPYSLAYIARILSQSETEILALCQSCQLSPKVDEATQQAFLSHRQLEALKVELTSRQALAEETDPEKNQAEQSSPDSPKTLDFSLPTHTSSSKLRKSHHPLKPELSQVIDAVGNVKESILKELAYILDDHLAGIDDVVIELIRSRSEVEALKNTLAESEQDRLKLQQEVAQFKPAAFGFYRKLK
jgi:hypothetical protein